MLVCYSSQLHVARKTPASALIESQAYYSEKATRGLYCNDAPVVLDSASRVTLRAP